MSDIATGQDADFSEERLIERYNTDLANSLGNLLNRTLNMAHRYRDGKLRSSKFTKDGLDRSQRRGYVNNSCHILRRRCLVIALLSTIRSTTLVTT